LPDGAFSNQKFPIRVNLGGPCKFGRALNWKKVDIYFMAIWNQILAICIFYGHWVILWQYGIDFPLFGILSQEKSGNPDEAAIS
jgi:hypothetical protein